MPFEIPVASLNAQNSQTVTLDGVVYRMTFTWNTRRLAWDLSIGLSDGTPLVQGVKILPQLDLLGRHRDIRLPKGTLLSVDVQETDVAIRPEKSQLGTKLRLLYWTEAENDALIS